MYNAGIKFVRYALILCTDGSISSNFQSTNTMYLVCYDFVLNHSIEFDKVFFFVKILRITPCLVISIVLEYVRFFKIILCLTSDKKQKGNEIKKVFQCLPK